jgi:myo-inositol 2-dehydrogenase/D-chiro-inositol 1-dehydrogenase
LAPTARVAVRSDLKVYLDFPPDWRGRFAEAYRRELQSWVDAIFRWRSGKVENDLGPVAGPDAWDGYRAAVISQAVLVSMSSNARATVESKPLPELYRRSRASAAAAGPTG